MDPPLATIGNAVADVIDFAEYVYWSTWLEFLIANFKSNFRVPLVVT